MTTHLPQFDVHFPLLQCLLFRSSPVLLFHLLESFPVGLHFLRKTPRSCGGFLHHLLRQNGALTTLLLALFGNLTNTDKLSANLI